MLKSVIIHQDASNITKLIIFEPDTLRLFAISAIRRNISLANI